MVSDYKAEFWNRWLFYILSKLKNNIPEKLTKKPVTSNNNKAITQADETQTENSMLERKKKWKKNLLFALCTKLQDCFL